MPPISPRALARLLVGLGVYHLALGAFQAVAPRAFYDVIGPFGPFNDHYVRDVATWSLALGGMLLAAARRPAWRAPILAFAVLQYALHAANHVFDVADADPGWVGPFDAVALMALTALLAVALRAAGRARGPAA